MTKQSHTPTPWILKYDEPQDNILRVTVTSENKLVEPIEEVLIAGGGNIEKMGIRSSNLYFIVRAVNSHDELVDALKKMVSYSEYLLAELSLPDNPIITKEAKNILAKAEGEEE